MSEQNLTVKEKFFKKRQNQTIKNRPLNERTDLNTKKQIFQQENRPEHKRIDL